MDDNNSTPELLPCRSRNHSGMFRYYAVALEQHKFREDDPMKSCVDYTETASYNDCDQKYIRAKFEEQFPSNFIPIWLTQNYSQVTTHFVHSPHIDEAYSGIVDGSEDSGFYHNDKVESS